MKKMFEPNWRDLPHGFLSTTRKGKRVYRIRLNTDEIVTQLEAGKTNMCIDILADNQGNPIVRDSNNKGNHVRRMPFYAWAMPAQKETP